MADCGSPGVSRSRKSGGAAVRPVRQAVDSPKGRRRHDRHHREPPHGPARLARACGPVGILGRLVPVRRHYGEVAAAVHHCIPAGRACCDHPQRRDRRAFYDRRRKDHGQPPARRHHRLCWRGGADRHGAAQGSRNRRARATRRAARGDVLRLCRHLWQALQENGHRSGRDRGPARLRPRLSCCFRLR